MNMIMKKMVLLLITFGLFGMSVTSFKQSEESEKDLFEGTWTLERCEIRKDSVGRKSDINYLLKDGNITWWYIFTEFSFSEEKNCFTIMNNDTIRGKYSVQDDNVLILDFIIMLPDYHYTFIDDSTLLLSRRHYLYNASRPERGFLDISMYFTKKEENENES